MSQTNNKTVSFYATSQDAEKLDKMMEDADYKNRSRFMSALINAVWLAGGLRTIETLVEEKVNR